MNNDYHMIRLEEAKKYQKAQLLEMYNDAVETIWELQRIKQELKEEIDFAKDMILRFYAERDDEGTACAFLAYRCLAEKAKKANLAIEELTEILGGDHGENG